MSTIGFHQCQRIIERDPEGHNHKLCPNEATVDVFGQINKLPYEIPMCDKHSAEFDQGHAAARARRNAANRAAAERRSKASRVTPARSVILHG